MVTLSVVSVAFHITFGFGQLCMLLSTEVYFRLAEGVDEVVVGAQIIFFPPIQVDVLGFCNDTPYLIKSGLHNASRSDDCSASFSSASV